MKHKNIFLPFMDDEILDQLTFLLMLDSSSEEDNYSYSTEWASSIPLMTSTQYYENFRMSRECFEKLLDKVSRFQGTLSNARFKLIVFVHYLAHATTYRRLRENWGVSHSTLFRIIDSMADILHNISIREVLFPLPSEYDELKEGLGGTRGVDGAILLIDGSLIDISRPSGNECFNYYSRKQKFSINLVCLVDYKRRFRGVSYGFGKSHDSRIYRTSNMRTLVENINDRTCYILGDSAFSGFFNMRICASTTTFPLSRDLEYSLSRQRVLVEHAFGIFKGKFKRFKVAIPNGESQKYVKILKSAIWIHNFIIDND